MNPRSKITAQGQISVPAEVRRELGAGPGETLEWEKRDGEYVVRRAGSVTFAEMRQILFGKKKPKAKTIEEMDEGIREYIRTRHARGRY